MTQTIERNYRKNPHTANFLMTFHAAAAGLPSDVDSENDYMTPVERELAAAEDLLNEVPVEAPAYVPTTRQQELISKLVFELIDLDLKVHGQAVEYNIRMDAGNAWTRENTSQWIDRLITKVRELRAAARSNGPLRVAEVADGRYAVEEDGVLRFFKVKNGRRPGFVFLDIQASDEWHAIRNVTRIHAILALIAQDPKGAMVRYGQELGECGHCGRTLTDEASRAAGLGPICASK